MGKATTLTAKGRTWKGVLYPDYLKAIEAARQGGTPIHDLTLIRRRLHAGKTLEQAITAPLRYQKSRAKKPTTLQAATQPKKPPRAHNPLHKKLKAEIENGGAAHGLKASTLSNRLFTYKWDPELAISTPPRPKEEGMVFMLRHTPSGKAYIGKTKVGGLEERLQLLVATANTRKGQKGSLSQALYCDGLAAFEVVVLEERVDDVLNAQREYIERYRTYENGLNDTRGGHRGGSGKHIWFNGKWHRSVQDLVAAEVPPDNVQYAYRAHRFLQKLPHGKKPTEEQIHQALEQVNDSRERSPEEIIHALELQFKKLGTCHSEKNSSLHRQARELAKSTDPLIRQQLARCGWFKPHGSRLWHANLQKWAQRRYQIQAGELTAFASPIGQKLLDWEAEVRAARQAFFSLRELHPTKGAAHAKTIGQRACVSLRDRRLILEGRYFEEADTYLREVGFLQEPTLEAELIARRLVEILGSKDLAGIPLRAVLGVLSRRRGHDTRMAEQLEPLLNQLRVFWGARQRRYVYRPDCFDSFCSQKG